MPPPPRPEEPTRTSRPWVKTFAWWPKKLINGKRAWLRTIYCRGGKIRVSSAGLYVDYIYTDNIFDVLKG